MSTPSGSTMKGKFNEAVGKVKESVGEAIGNERLANAGAAQQIEGHAEQTWGAVKEGAQDIAVQKKPAAEAQAHDIREKVTSTAQNVKEHVKAGIDDLMHRKAS